MKEIYILQVPQNPMVHHQSLTVPARLGSMACWKIPMSSMRSIRFSHGVFDEHLPVKKGADFSLSCHTHHVSSAQDTEQHLTGRGILQVPSSTIPSSNGNFMGI